MDGGKAAGSICCQAERLANSQTTCIQARVQTATGNVFRDETVGLIGIVLSYAVRRRGVRRRLCYH
jgi:hypothetical protein